MSRRSQSQSIRKVDAPYVATSRADAASWASNQHGFFLEITTDWRFNSQDVDELRSFLADLAKQMWDTGELLTVRKLVNLTLSTWLKDREKRPPTYRDPEQEALNRCICAWVNHLSRIGCIPMQPSRVEARAYDDLRGRYIVQLCRGGEPIATFSVGKRVTLLDEVPA